MMSFYLTKLFPLSNFDRLISANIGAMNKLPITGPLHFNQRRGFGPHQDVIDICLMTHKVLQVKYIL